MFFRFLFFTILLASVASSANLVLNGDFEQPSLYGASYHPYYSGSTELTGWDVWGPDANRGVDLVNIAHTGEQSVDMSGSPGPGAITQLLSTVPGMDYVLSFYVSSNGGPYEKSLKVRWNGGEIATLDSPVQGTWTRYTYDVKATSDTTELAFIDNLENSSSGALVDTVSVEAATPEPASFVLFGGALAGIPLLRRMRRS